MSRHINLGDTTTSDRNGGLGWGKVVNFALWQMGWLLLDRRDMSCVSPGCWLGVGARWQKPRWVFGRAGPGSTPVRLLTKSRPKTLFMSLSRGERALISGDPHQPRKLRLTQHAASSGAEIYIRRAAVTICCLATSRPKIPFANSTPAESIVTRASLKSVRVCTGNAS